jgi:hypothetical protein
MGYQRAGGLGHRVREIPTSRGFRVLGAQRKRDTNEHGDLSISVLQVDAMVHGGEPVCCLCRALELLLDVLPPNTRRA